MLLSTYLFSRKIIISFCRCSNNLTVNYFYIPFVYKPSIKFYDYCLWKHDVTQEMTGDDIFVS